MSPTYTAKVIQDLVGPQYRVKAARGNGNFQVNLELKDAGLSGHAKCTLMLEAFKNLRAAGYPLEETDLKTDSKGADGIWRSWLCIYVNKPQANAGGADAASIAAGVAAVLAAMGIKFPTQTPEVQVTPEVPAEEPI